jgi:class 3 adenylate cyclase
MSLLEDLKKEVADVFHQKWDVIEGRAVPEDPAKVPFGNRGVSLDGTVLYADLADSTALVDHQPRGTAAEVYKTYLHCAGKIVRGEGGVITAYDGDRIMAVFIGNSKNTSAVRAALRIEYARNTVINPAFKKQYPSINYAVRHAIGIAASTLLVARTGVWGANDLVWVGSAANHAAKLTVLPEFPIWITKPVFDVLDASVKVANMWQARTWTSMGQRIYGTTYQWEF